jgi:hypothetical protein
MLAFILSGFSGIGNRYGSESIEPVKVVIYFNICKCGLNYRRIAIIYGQDLSNPAAFNMEFVRILIFPESLCPSV